MRGEKKYYKTDLLGVILTFAGGIIFAMIIYSFVLPNFEPSESAAQPHSHVVDIDGVEHTVTTVYDNNGNRIVIVTGDGIFEITYRDDVSLHTVYIDEFGVMQAHTEPR